MKKEFVVFDQMQHERELVVALQSLLSSFTLLKRPSRISVHTTRFGWQTGAVTDGTEAAIEEAVHVLRKAARHLKTVDPEWKHGPDELFPLRRFRAATRKNLL